MPAPEATTTTPHTGHPNYIVFTGDGDLKETIAAFGMVFDAEVADDTVHALIVDPRFSTGDVIAYVIELGGNAYLPPG